MLKDERDRHSDFVKRLKQIEFQACRISDNRNFTEMAKGNRTHIHEKGIDLMTGILKFFNCSLNYFSRSNVGNLWNTVFHGPEVYEEGVKTLTTAIAEYDQAVIDLTVAFVAGTILHFGRG